MHEIFCKYFERFEKGVEGENLSFANNSSDYNFSWERQIIYKRTGDVRILVNFLAVYKLCQLEAHQNTKGLSSYLK